MTVRILAVIVLLAGAVAWNVQPAAACSCAGGETRDRLDAASAAFVGRVVSRALPEQGITSSGSLVTYTFEVEATVKGDIGETVDVLSAVSGISCGFEFGVPHGERAGILLSVGGDGAYYGGLCGTVDPDLLLAAVSPLPSPDGQGPVSFLIGGDYGPARLIALDSEGRTLAYGFGEGPTGAIAACPGESHSVEVFGPEDDLKIGVRDLSTFEVLSVIGLNEPIVRSASMFVNDDQSGIPARRIDAIDCFDPSGTDAVFHINSFGTLEKSVIARVRFNSDPSVEVLWTGVAESVTFSTLNETAYLITSEFSGNERAAKEYAVRQLDLNTKHLVEVASLPRFASENIWSLISAPNTETVAMVIAQDSNPWKVRIALVDASSETAQVVERTLEGGTRATRLLWTEDDRLMAVLNDDTAEALLYDTSLNLAGSHPALDYVDRPVLSSGKIYGFTFGDGFGAATLSSIDLNGGNVAQHGKFDMYSTLAFVPLSSGQQIVTGSPVDPGEDGNLSGIEIVRWSVASLAVISAIVFGYAFLHPAIQKRRRNAHVDR